MEARDRYLRAAADVYYWKPMAAFYDVMELEALAPVLSPATPGGPVLDLGCSDGRFGRLVAESHRGGQPLEVGLDWKIREVASAARGSAYGLAVAGRAEALPFPAGAFPAVVSFKTLDAVEDLPASLNEIHRVLRPGGILVLTVITDAFFRQLLLPRALRRLGSEGLARVYEGRVQARLKCNHRLATADWHRKLERAGFVVEVRRTFLPPQAAAIWNVLALTPLRAFGLLCLIPPGRLTRFLARLVEAGLGPLVRRAGSVSSGDLVALVVARADGSP